MDKQQVCVGLEENTEGLLDSFSKKVHHPVFSLKVLQSLITSDSSAKYYLKI